MRDVISWLERRAFVKIFGDGNLEKALVIGNQAKTGCIREVVDALTGIANLFKVRRDQRHVARLSVAPIEVQYLNRLV